MTTTTQKMTLEEFLAYDDGTDNLYLLVLSEELATVLEGASRSIVLMDMPPPLLAVEVVLKDDAQLVPWHTASHISPNQEKRDYRYKRSEYAARGIIEYWIVDPIQQQVTILELVEGFYEEKVYRDSDRIYSPLLTQIDLTVERVLQAR